jgi:hypothetical protein
LNHVLNWLRKEYAAGGKGAETVKVWTAAGPREFLSPFGRLLSPRTEWKGSLKPGLAERSRGMLSRKKFGVLTLAAIAGAAILVTQTAGSKGRADRLWLWACGNTPTARSSRPR